MTTKRYLLVEVEVGDRDKEATAPTTRDWSEYVQLRWLIEHLETEPDRARVSAVYELTDDGLRFQRHLVVRNAD